MSAYLRIRLELAKERMVIEMGVVFAVATKG